ncbi:uncharacterized protein LOC122076016 [Macadamia integrifolia]|uniref:uncharacterized protein LOC122076016 n=1 Tax=Macadamia integrifolia TaxID=60698 RepID=UPI001C4E5902|nr:uncharacterized protein LOC122076016 [Macadamia integrifolia]
MDSEVEEAKKVELQLNAKYDVGLIHQAINQLIEEKRAQRSKASGDCFVDDDDGVLLSRLLSQLESLKEDTSIEPLKPASEMDVRSTVNKEESKDENVGGSESGSREIGEAAILRELRKLKRQNSITHWLLSIMIFLTVAWQLSEVSLLMIVKNKLSNPFRTVGTAVKGMLPGRGKDDTNGSTNLLQIETPSLHGLKMPELPSVGLPVLGLNDEDH